jgi:SAM-dependent methyltransferase
MNRPPASAVWDDAEAVSASRERLRSTFDSAASIYDRARPSYPPRLFDELVTMAELLPGARLLEIGAGTGKATLPLVQHGFDVVCVELGTNLAARAREVLTGYPVEIHIGPFESWEGEHQSYDLVFAATAWHWIDPAVRYRKAHELLRPSGHLAFWSAGHAFPAGFDPFFTEIQAVYDAIGESHAGEWPPPPSDQTPDDAAEIEASDLFHHVQVRRYVWETVYTADEYIALLGTFSGHIAMEPDKRSYLYGEILSRIATRNDRRIRRHWQATLHVATPTR